MSQAARIAKEEPGKKGGGFDLKAAKTVLLENGLKLILLENHRLPIVVAHANVNHVRLYEPADQVGIAALMGILLEEGTATRTGPQIAKMIEDTGGELDMNAGGGSVKVLTDDTDVGLDLLFDCLIHPKFGKDEVESKQEQLLASLAEDEQRPETRAQRAFRAAVYGKHPLGRPPARADVVKSFKPKDLKAFHRKVFVPNNTVVAVVGDFDSDKLVAGIKKRTAGWKAGKLPELDLPAPPPPKASELIISEPTAAQLTVYLGHIGIKRNNPDYYRLLVLDYILGTGTGFTDRLSATLRDRQGLAYTVSAGITSSAGEEPGTFTGYIGTFPDKYAEVKAGFLKEINRIRDEAPSREEVEDVKAYLTGSLAFSLTTCAGGRHVVGRGPVQAGGRLPGGLPEGGGGGHPGGRAGRGPEVPAPGPAGGRGRRPGGRGRQATTDGLNRPPGGGVRMGTWDEAVPPRHYRDRHEVVHAHRAAHLRGRRRRVRDHVRARDTAPTTPGRTSGRRWAGPERARRPGSRC